MNKFYTKKISEKSYKMQLVHVEIPMKDKYKEN
jgi:hypothetical protein